MAKYKTTPINRDDIIEYLGINSDFSFEIKVLRELSNLGLKCTHGGTYTDPMTGKTREFDIRARYQRHGAPVRCHLSVECKNLQTHFPLVMHCMRRLPHESYNELIHTFGSLHTAKMITPVPSSVQANARSIRVTGDYTLYRKVEYVGKSTDQVGRNTDGSIAANDAQVFDKISQAVNSARDLIYQAYVMDAKEEEFLTFVCPVLVVPDDTLWQIKYVETGAVVHEPEKVSRVSYYIGKEWEAIEGLHLTRYNISHLEIVTLSHLPIFVEEYLRDYINLWQSMISRGVEFN